MGLYLGRSPIASELQLLRSVPNVISTVSQIHKTVYIVVRSDNKCMFTNTS
jgi:hypothetical protein